MDKEKKKPSISVAVIASIINVITSFITGALSFITVPIFTRIMGSDEIGTVNLYNSWQAMIGTFASLSLASGGYMVAMQKYKNSRDQYMSSVLTLTSFVAAFIAIIYGLGWEFWNSITGLTMPMMGLMIAGFFLTPATDFWISRKRYEYDYIKPSIITVLSAVLSAIVSVLAVIVADRKFQNSINTGEVRIFASALIPYFFGMVFWIYTMYKGRCYVDTRYWKFSLGLSIPLIGHTAAMQILNVSDRTMIDSMVGRTEVGIYGILYNVSSISSIVWTAINASFIPFLFENIEKKEKRQDIKKVSFSILFVYSVVAVLMTLLAPELIKLLATEEYYEAIYIMPPIAAGIFMIALSNLYSNILVYYKQTKYIMVSSAIAAFLNILLNYFAIQKWGYIAAAYTTLISYTALGLLQQWISRNVRKKVIGLKDGLIYEDFKLLLLAFTTAIICIVCVILYNYFILRYSCVCMILLYIFMRRKQIVLLFKLRSKDSMK